MSHATADKWLACVLCEKIESVGATTFRDDRDINGGDDIPEAIRREIRRSKEMLVLLTPVSVASEWVKTEVGAAWGRRGGYRITALLCHVDFDLLPTMLKTKKAYSLNDADHYFAEVMERARSIHV